MCFCIKQQHQPKLAAKTEIIASFLFHVYPRVELVADDAILMQLVGKCLPCNDLIIFKNIQKVQRDGVCRMVFESLEDFGGLSTILHFSDVFK